MTAIWLNFIGNLLGRLIWPVTVIVLALKFQGSIGDIIRRVVSFEAWGANPNFYREYTFEEWVGFMVRETLITIADGQCAITEFGKEFLLYAIETGAAARPN